jgi:hypothetical protein
MDIDPEVVARRIQKFVREQLAFFERDGAILGMSGGIDCAVVSWSQGSGTRSGAGRAHARARLFRQAADALKEIDWLGIATERSTSAPPLGTRHLQTDPLRLLGKRCEGARCQVAVLLLRSLASTLLSGATGNRGLDEVSASRLRLGLPAPSTARG